MDNEGWRTAAQRKAYEYWGSTKVCERWRTLAEQCSTVSLSAMDYNQIKQLVES